MATRLRSPNSIESLFKGRMVSDVKVAVNCLVFTFTDGGMASLEVEAVHPHLGLYGIAVREEKEGNAYDPGIAIEV